MKWLITISEHSDTGVKKHNNNAICINGALKLSV